MVSSPKLRIKPSNRAYYKQPREGEVVLSGKTGRFLAFKVYKVESKSTWTLLSICPREKHQSEKSCLNLNKTTLAYKMSGYKLDMHRLEIKLLMDGKSVRTSQQQQKRQKSSLKNPLRVLQMYLNLLPKNQESEESVDVASAKMAGFP